MLVLAVMSRIEYTGTARREAEMIEQKVAEARDGCKGPKRDSVGFWAAWDEER